MSRRGVTLIELLIAVSLLALLSVGMLLALRVGLGALDKANSKLIANRRAASVQRILASEIANFMPAPALCVAGPGQPPQRMPFFDGQPQAMRFVSTYSLEEAGRGYPRILEYLVIPGDKGQGFRLVVNELLYTGPRSTGALCTGIVADPVQGVLIPQFRPIQIGPRSFVLADKLAYCRFAYREAGTPPKPDRWVDAWQSHGWPIAVRVDMAPLEADPSRVPLAGVTVMIHARRNPNVRYAN